MNYLWERICFWAGISMGFLMSLDFGDTSFFAILSNWNATFLDGSRLFFKV